MSSSDKTILILVCVALMLGNAAGSLYLPAFVAIRDTFHITAAQVKLTMSAYVICFALSQLVYGPLSDAFGRRINLIIGLVIYVLGVVLSTVAWNYAILLLSRLITGLGAGTTHAVGFAILRDKYNGIELTQKISRTATAVSVMVIFAPLVGGNVTQYLGWRWCFVLLSVIGVVLILLKCRALPETSLSIDRHACHPYRVMKNYVLLLKSRIFLGYILMAGFAFALMLVQAIMLPFTIIQQLHVTAAAYGWIYALISLGYFAGTLLGAHLVKWRGVLQTVRGIALLELLSLVIAYALLRSYFSVAFVIPISCVFLLWVGILVPVASSGAMQPFPEKAGSSAALLGAVMFGVATLFSAVASGLHQHSIMPMLGLMLLITVLISLSSLLCK